MRKIYWAARQNGNFSSTGSFNGAPRYIWACEHHHRTREAAVACAAKGKAPGTIEGIVSGQTIVLDHGTFEPLDG